MIETQHFQQYPVQQEVRIPLVILSAFVQWMNILKTYVGSGSIDL